MLPQFAASKFDRTESVLAFVATGAIDAKDFTKVDTIRVGNVDRNAGRGMRRRRGALRRTFLIFVTLLASLAPRRCWNKTLERAVVQPHRIALAFHR
jgi:hypothetical protein